MILPEDDDGAANAVPSEAKSGGDGDEVTSAAARTTPYNPFLYTGALTLCSIIGRGYEKKSRRLFLDAGTRFTHLFRKVKQLAGGAPISFNKPTSLTLNKRGLKVQAADCMPLGRG